MKCRVKIGEWHDGDTVGVAGYTVERDKEFVLEATEMKQEIEEHPGLELTWIYTEDELKKLPTAKLNAFLNRVKKANEAKRTRTRLLGELMEEAKL